ncbi:MAG: hypothetical protein WCB57_17570 [Pseudonocardiaceae bacterium]
MNIVGLRNRWLVGVAVVIVALVVGTVMLLRYPLGGSEQVRSSITAGEAVPATGSVTAW